MCMLLNQTDILFLAQTYVMFVHVNTDTASTNALAFLITGLSRNQTYTAITFMAGVGCGVIMLCTKCTTVDT